MRRFLTTLMILLVVLVAGLSALVLLVNPNILEGILLLTDARLRDELNFSIFVDTPLDICLMRRIKRDVNERGRSMDSVMAQYQKTVRPMFLQFIEPSKQYADIIVPRGGKNRIAIDILKAKISQFFE